MNYFTNMCMRALLLSFIFLFFAIHGLSQKTEITGRIFNYTTKLPLEGVTVYELPGSRAVMTDESGRFDFQTRQPIEQIRVSSVGYETKFIGIGELLEGQNTIYLQEKNVQLSEVTVSADPLDQSKPISRIDIKMRGINNSQEVLRMVPGLFIAQHAGGGKAEQIFLRGFDLDHGTDISISVDGIPVNMVSHAHGQGYADLHFLIPELIESVNFEKGSYYSGKGNFATSGFVDLKTLNAIPCNSIKLEGGMFGTFRAFEMFNLLQQKLRNRQQSAYIASEYSFTNGYFDHPQRFNRFNLYGKYYAQLNNNNVLCVSASAFKSKWNASGQIPERAVESGQIGFFGSIDPNEGGITSRYNLNVQLTSTLRNGGYIKNQLYYSRYGFKLYSNFTFFKEDSVNGDQIRQKEDRNLLGYNGSYTQIHYTGNIKITSEVGAGIRFDDIRNSELSRTVNRSVETAALQLGNIDEVNISAYASEIIHVNPRLIIKGGLRFDEFYNRYRDKLNNNNVLKSQAGIVGPKLGFYYQVNNKTQIYLTSGKGFHSNNTRVVVQKNGLGVLPSAYGIDLGTSFKPASRLFVSLAVWYLWMEQEFIYVGDAGGVEPRGKSRRLGMDASFRYQPASWLFFDFDANYSKARSVSEPKGKNYLPLSPVFTSIGGVTVKTKAGINGSIRYRYMSDHPANEDNSHVAKGYFINDGVLSFARRRYEMAIVVQNIFNVRWKEAQFDTESRLKGEPAPVTEIHFTPGTPVFVKLSFSYLF